MFPRRKSTFHLQEEEEEEEEAGKTKKSAIRDQFQRAKLWQPETKLEGLRLLIHHSGEGNRNNVVIKCSLKYSSASSSSYSSSKASPLMSFLKACSLCKRELCPHKDVYMYRGDQGFCSEECRRRQILRDERKELDAMLMRERSKAFPPHRRHQIVAKPPLSDRRRKILAAA